jgi:hypothetical protein
MRQRDKEKYLDKIREKASALSRLTQHTSDPDLIGTAFQSLKQAVEEYQDALADD